MTDCLRRAVAAVREEALADRPASGRPAEVTTEALLARAAALLAEATTPHLREAINATGRHPAHRSGPGGLPGQRGGLDNR